MSIAASLPIAIIMFVVVSYLAGTFLTAAG